MNGEDLVINYDFIRAKRRAEEERKHRISVIKKAILISLLIVTFGGACFCAGMNYQVKSNVRSAAF